MSIRLVLVINGYHLSLDSPTLQNMEALNLCKNVRTLPSKAQASASGVGALVKHRFKVGAGIESTLRMVLVCLAWQCFSFGAHWDCILRLSKSRGSLPLHPKTVML